MNTFKEEVEMHALSIVYVIYAAVSIGLTVWLARTLAKNGRVFLADVFPDNQELAASVNQLLVVGFYLANIGYACLLLTGGHSVDVQTAIENLAGKFGVLLLSFAFMHFMNMFILHRIRRRARRASEPVPMRHHGFVSPPAAIVAPMQTQG